MDSAEFLDILGNANRRRILRLLAERPCYVTEISDFLGVSPKAVIDHLEKLEAAGLVESRTDSKRRKYFSIARHVRLEVTVSPYEFGTKSAYPASSRLDITSCRQLSIDLEHDPETADSGVTASEVEPDDVVSLTEALHDVEQLENELSLAQRWAQGKLTELREHLESVLDDEQSRLLADLLLALADDSADTETLGREVGAPPGVVEELLEKLVDEGIVREDEGTYRLIDA
ncbi:metalloregulator ArsR/SmtB family transcription factor [Halovenus sp. WSH3]|uniref:Metalloregulator ArsR/SmtB family transcription factor n=1 Tax=Halovenus carboxidivorans TaxID=2692199 RepID=A0A6B0TCV5_9EURY|nr:metalloregulator ArsR/SmtB family transcription factor [Halovenus carboxidivorans]MXR52750.1 metalloregulator ArsR/SmtB family transcription factor [Halovenus carboxidivorans]